jgi:hypothetical protein
MVAPHCAAGTAVARLFTIKMSVIKKNLFLTSCRHQVGCAAMNQNELIASSHLFS